MSWLDQLIGKLTIAQAQTLYQFLALSEAGDRLERIIGDVEGF